MWIVKTVNCEGSLYCMMIDCLYLLSKIVIYERFLLSIKFKLREFCWSNFFRCLLNVGSSSIETWTWPSRLTIYDQDTHAHTHTHTLTQTHTHTYTHTLTHTHTHTYTYSISTCFALSHVRKRDGEKHASFWRITREKNVFCIFN